MENSINRRVQVLIDALRKNNNSFAKSIDKTSTTINNITNGRSKPSFELLEAICEVYPQVNTSWLLLGEGSMFNEGAGTDGQKEPRDDQYLQDQIKKLEENFSRLANQLEVKDTQIQSLSEMLKMTLGKSDLGEKEPCEIRPLLSYRQTA